MLKFEIWTTPPPYDDGFFRKRSSTGRRRSSITVKNGPGLNGVDPGVDEDNIFDDDDADGDCWHELKDEDGSGLGQLNLNVIYGQKQNWIRIFKALQSHWRKMLTLFQRLAKRLITCGT